MASKKIAVDLSVPAIRTWARENGVTVGTRGRISAELVSAYKSANGVK